MKVCGVLSRKVMSVRLSISKHNFLRLCLNTSIAEIEHKIYRGDRKILEGNNTETNACSSQVLLLGCKVYLIWVRVCKVESAFIGLIDRS